MGKYKTLGINSIYVMIGTFGSKFISFLMLPFYTAWFSVSDYGLSDLLIVYSSLLSCVLTLSLHEAIFVYPVGKDKNTQRSYFSTGLWTILLLAGISLIFSLLISYIRDTYGISNTIFTNIWYLYFIYITTSIQTYLQQFCRSINKMKTFCYSGIIYTLLTATFSFLLIPEYGIKGYVISFILANIISSSFIFVIEKIYEYIELFIRWRILKSMANYSMPLIPNTLMWWILSAINRPIIDNSLGLTGVGLFAVANKFPTLLSQVAAIFNGSWQVSVLQEFHKKDFINFFTKIGDIYINTMIVLSSTLCLCSRFIVELTTDEKFHEAWSFVPIIAISVVFQSICTHTGTIFSATRLSRYFLTSSLIGAIMSIVCNLLLIPQFGLYGASLSFAISQFSIAAARLIFCKKIIDYNISKNTFILLLLNISIIIATVLAFNIHSYLFYITLVSLYVYYNIFPIWGILMSNFKK